MAYDHDMVYDRDVTFFLKLTLCKKNLDFFGLGRDSDFRLKLGSQVSLLNVVLVYCHPVLQCMLSKDYCEG